MIEIFTTNVTKRSEAEMVLKKIESVFPGYRANFDLEDCDHVLRIDTRGAEICNSAVIELMERLGFRAMVMPDGANVENSVDV